MDERQPQDDGYNKQHEDDYSEQQRDYGEQGDDYGEQGDGYGEQGDGYDQGYPEEEEYNEENEYESYASKYIDEEEAGGDDDPYAEPAGGYGRPTAARRRLLSCPRPRRRSVAGRAAVRSRQGP